MRCASRYEKPHRCIQWGFSDANNEDEIACILVSTNAQKTRISLHRRLAFVCFANSCVTDVCNACILVSTNAQKTCVSLHRKAVADDACASSGLAHRAKLSPINGLHQPFHLPILSMSHPFCCVKIRRFPSQLRWCICHFRKSQGNHTWCRQECHSRHLMERP